ncbi:MAG: PEP-CTERM sorting domain-containing protein [Phycisphaerales bacterium]|nr:PEP-CTERM sorting domain-containing protein [Phycisphaerales bacterium]
MNRIAPIVSLVLAAGVAAANPVNGDYFDLPQCDNHGNQTAIEELGTRFLFPQNELIEGVSNLTQLSACPMSDDPNIPNALVTIRNLTGKSWTDLFYVADPQTTLSNMDGMAESSLAIGGFTPSFRIDSIGMNQNLVFESISADGIFQPNEQWGFIIQDYTNGLGRGAHEMDALDFAFGTFGGPDSSGSIVQFNVPAPGSAALLGLGALAIVRRRRS